MPFDFGEAESRANISIVLSAELVAAAWMPSPTRRIDASAIGSDALRACYSGLISM
jgi:hypothetical protein